MHPPAWSGRRSPPDRLMYCRSWLRKKVEVLSCSGPELLGREQIEMLTGWPKPQPRCHDRARPDLTLLGAPCSIRTATARRVVGTPRQQHHRSLFLLSDRTSYDLYFRPTRPIRLRLPPPSPSVAQRAPPPRPYVPALVLLPPIDYRPERIRDASHHGRRKALQ